MIITGIETVSAALSREKHTGAAVFLTIKSLKRQGHSANLPAMQVHPPAKSTRQSSEVKPMADG